MGKTTTKISKRIKELRIEKGFSQVELANFLKVKQATIANWEAGKRIPTIDILVEITKIFKCSLDYLVGIEDF